MDTSELLNVNVESLNGEGVCVRRGIRARWAGCSQQLGTQAM